MRNFANEFQNLSRNINEEDYTLSSANISADGSCSGKKVHSGTWVKKLANWDHQHSNGMTAGVRKNGQPVAFKDIDRIVLELKINSDKTDIPSKATHASKYGQILDQTQLDRLDNGKLAFALTFNNPGEQAGMNTVRAETYLEIDQMQYADEWIRVEIPIENMHFWSGVEYDKDTMQFADVQNNTTDILYFNPETKGNDGPSNYGNVIRNILWPMWEEINPFPEEDFKEMNISIKTFEVRFK